jgi:hypothetical protein
MQQSVEQLYTEIQNGKRVDQLMANDLKVIF